MLKSAAWTVDKTAARDRHLRDAALLLSLMDEPESQLERLHSVNDRRRVILLHDELTEMDWLQRIGWFRGGGDWATRELMVLADSRYPRRFTEGSRGG